MLYAAIVFDLDGTLLDTENIALTAGMDVATAHELPFDRDFFESLIGKDGPTVETAIAAASPAGFNAQKFKADWGAMFRNRAETGIPLKAGVIELLDHLDEIPLPRAVATNSSFEGAILSLNRAGIADRIHHVVGHDLVPRPKPAPDVFLEAAKRLGVAPGRCLAFEDSALGTQAAIEAGMTVVHVPDMVRPNATRAHYLAETLLDGARMAGLML